MKYRAIFFFYCNITERTERPELAEGAILDSVLRK